MLLGPSRHDVRPLAPDRLECLDPSGAESARGVLYARAALLDWTIDPLADWIEAGHEPEHGAAIRESSRRVHAAALEGYLARYGRGRGDDE